MSLVLVTGAFQARCLWTSGPFLRSGQLPDPCILMGCLKSSRSEQKPSSLHISCMPGLERTCLVLGPS